MQNLLHQSIYQNKLLFELEEAKSRILSLSRKYFSVCNCFVVEENRRESESIKFSFPFIFPSTFKNLASGFLKREKQTGGWGGVGGKY